MILYSFLFVCCVLQVLFFVFHHSASFLNDMHAHCCVCNTVYFSLRHFGRWNVSVVCLTVVLILWRPAAFGNFRKKGLNACGFAQEYLRSCLGHGPGRSVKRRGKSSTQLSKKIFCLGVAFFCEWHHKWRAFRLPWPTFPDPGRQPLGGSISMKFLLEIRLQSESFDTLDDLLGFRVQKL